MHHQQLDPAQQVHAYGVDLQVLYPWEGVVQTPFGAAWALLAPGRSTKPHQHQEGETFIIARGEGVMTVDGEEVPVSQGSVIYQQPFHQHTLTNTSEQEDLLFLTVWWEDRKLWEQTQPRLRALRQRVMVTAAPPTPNGDLHLGHLSGPYLGADLHARYLRLRGHEVGYACGSDDHCMYVERQGEAMGLSGEEAARHFVDAIRDSLNRAGIRMDLFLVPQPGDRLQHHTLRLYQRLRQRGLLELRETDSPHCETCRGYLFEADIAGICPHCRESMTGNTCENCGRIHDCREMLEPRCTSCGQTPVSRRVQRLFFPLSQWRDPLRSYLDQVTMGTRLRAFCEQLLAEGLPDVAVSHPSTWGIPVPGDEAELEGQTLYVWFEMAARYLAYAEALSQAQDEDADAGYERFWKSEQASIVQFFGFDNSFYYSLLMPALYLAMDEDLQLPQAFVVNEFYRLQGQKFSTTRGHSILGRDLLAVAPRDALRWYLAWSGPEKEQSNFTLESFESTAQRELAEGWLSWLHQMGTKVSSLSDGQAPATGDWTQEQLRFYRFLETSREQASLALEPDQFSPQRLCRLLSELVREARGFGRGEDHWLPVAERSQEWRTGLALELLAAKLLAVLSSALMPDFAQRLWSALGYQDELGGGTWDQALEWVPANQPVNLNGDLSERLIPGLATLGTQLANFAAQTQSNPTQQRASITLAGA